MARYVVEFQKNIEESIQKNMVESHGATSLNSLFGVFELIEATEEVAQRLKELPEVVDVEKDEPVAPKAQAIEYSLNVTNVKVNAFDKNQRGAGVTVAIVDSGIIAHEDLPTPTRYCHIKDGVILSVDNAADCLDDFGHGTECAGVICMQNNTLGYLGVAPDVNLVVVKAGQWFDTTYAMHHGDMALSIQWCADNGVDVVSLSYGQYQYMSVVAAACQYAYERNVSVIVPAGNEANDDVGNGNYGNLTETERVNFWKEYNGAVVTAAVHNNNGTLEWAYYSSYGEGIDFTAPSLYMLPTYDSSTAYELKQGTSFSTPFLAGMVAILRGKFPGITVDQIYNFLLENATVIGNGDKRYFGNGMPVMPDLSLSYPLYAGTNETAWNFNGLPVSKILFNGQECSKVMLNSFPLWGETAPPASSPLVSDTFDRADNATTLGNAETGQTWLYTGVWGIDTNAAEMQSGSGTVLHSYVESGISDGTVSVKFLELNNENRLVFRLQDATNYLTVHARASDYAIKKVVSGTTTTLQTIAQQPVAGDIVKVELNGSTVKVFVNGVEIASRTETTFQAATKHGFATYGGVSPKTRFDNFEVTTL